MLKNQLFQRTKCVSFTMDVVSSRQSAQRKSWTYQNKNTESSVICFKYREVTFTIFQFVSYSVGSFVIHHPQIETAQQTVTFCIITDAFKADFVSTNKTKKSIYERQGVLGVTLITTTTTITICNCLLLNCLYNKIVLGWCYCLIQSCP